GRCPLELANPFPVREVVALRVTPRYIRNAKRLLDQQLGIRPADVLAHIDEAPAAQIARKLGLVVQPADPGVGIRVQGVDVSQLSAEGTCDDDLALLQKG